MAQSSIMLHYGGTFPYTHTQETEIMNESKLKILFSASTVVCNGNVKRNKMCLKLRGSN